MSQLNSGTAAVVPLLIFVFLVIILIPLLNICLLRFTDLLLPIESEGRFCVCVCVCDLSFFGCFLFSKDPKFFQDPRPCPTLSLFYLWLVAGSYIACTRPVCFYGHIPWTKCPNDWKQSLVLLSFELVVQHCCYYLLFRKWNGWGKHQLPENPNKTAAGGRLWWSRGESRDGRTCRIQ